jgi:streptomycin 6-kinase
LDDLEYLIWDLERRWSLEVGAAMPQSGASFVAEAKRADGTPVVLKVAMPADVDGPEALEREARVLTSAGGRGCVRMLAYDSEMAAMLLEQLGAPLAESGLPLDRQLTVICETLPRLWANPPDPTMPSEVDRAAWVGDFLGTEWERQGRPCPEALIDLGRQLAGRRSDSFRPERAVLAHGDGHAWNTLGRLSGHRSYVLIDPDGFFAQPEYDLAISMREYLDDLLAGDPLIRGRRRASFLARATGLDADIIWEWGYLELLVNALMLTKTDKNPEAGQISLFVAHHWAQARA